MSNRYRVTASTHREGTRIYKEGEFIVTDRDMVALYANKFLLVESNVSAPAAPTASVDAPPTPKPDAESEEDDLPEPVDVTAGFAAEIGEHVGITITHIAAARAKGGGYFVRKHGEPVAEGVTKTQLQAFLQNL
jgi:hypothetical protein